MNKTQMAVALFDKYADSYQSKYMDVSLYGETFDLFCEQTAPVNARILELACGPGNITRYLLDKRPDFRLLGIDLAPNMLRLAGQNNPAATFQLMDCRDIRSLEGPFDAIMAGFCLPYLSKEESIQLIADAAQLLTPSGMLYLSAMEGDYLNSGLHSASSGEQMYLHYHQAGYLTHALLENNFSLVHTRRFRYVAPNGADTTDLVLIARRH